MSTPDLMLRLTIAAYAAGALGALLLRGRGARLAVAVGAAVGSSTALGLACLVLGGATAPGLEVRMFALAPLRFQLDPLGAVFLAAVGIVGLSATLYGYAYTAAYREASAARIVGVNHSALLLALSLQVMAANPITFLLLWETVSLAAYFLVLAEPDQPGAVSAATWYLSVTHAGFAALVAMFLLLSGGRLDVPFEALRAGALSSGVRHAIFVLALVGFGTKAGIIPLHVWLPRAHPVAPSHASALMSGVVLKMGIYGLVRVVFDLLPAAGGSAAGPPAWWGIVVLSLGTVSALFGVLYALMEHDLKRLLAFHSIENIGIIFMGLGAALLFLGYGLPLAGALALVAALYHTLNHACFKGLLFLAAGAVVQATGTRNMEEMGGLIKRMPRTALAFLVGAVAISALPPLNGFASEWLLFQSLLGGARIPAPSVALAMPIAVGILALTGGLAAACFVKAFGITFLAIPRSPGAEGATEVPLAMQAGMALLAAACVALGLGPSVMVPLLGRALSPLPALHVAAGLGATNGFFTGLPDGFGQMSLPYVAVGLLALLVLVPLALRIATSRLRLRRADTWGCGRFTQTPRMQYTATAFAEPLRRVFAELYRPTEDLAVTVHPESKYFIRGITYKSRVRPWVETLVYAPLVALVSRAAVAVRSMQTGSVHLYLAYMCAALLALLFAARVFP
jgi:hydrogenase-4 component B